MSDLRECPFCLGVDITAPPHRDACVYCKTCGARAVNKAAWQARATPSPTLDEAAIVEAWYKVSDALNDIPGGMHVDLEDAASGMWGVLEAAVAIRREGVTAVGEDQAFADAIVTLAKSFHSKGAQTVSFDMEDGRVEVVIRKAGNTPTPNAAADALADVTELVATGIDGSRCIYIRNQDGSWPALATRIEPPTHRQQQPGTSHLNDEGRA